MLAPLVAPLLAPVAPCLCRNSEQAPPPTLSALGRYRRSGCSHAPEAETPNAAPSCVQCVAVAGGRRVVGGWQVRGKAGGGGWWAPSAVGVWCVSGGLRGFLYLRSVFKLLITSLIFCLSPLPSFQLTHPPILPLLHTNNRQDVRRLQDPATRFHRFGAQREFPPSCVRRPASCFTGSSHESLPSVAPARSASGHCLHLHHPPSTPNQTPPIRSVMTCIASPR